MSIPSEHMMPDSFFEDAPVAYVVTDATGLIRRINRALLAWTGRAETDLVGRSLVQDLLSAGSRIYFETHVGPVLALHGVVNDVLLKLASSEGTTIFTVCSAKRILNPANKHANDHANIGNEGKGNEGNGVNDEVMFVFVNTSDRQQFENDAHRAKARLERLQRLTSAFAVAVTVEEIEAAALTEILDGVKGDHGFVARLSGEKLIVGESSGVVVPEAQAGRTLNRTNFPEAIDVIGSGTVAFLENVPDGAHGSTPDHVGSRGRKRVAILPLRTQGGTFGVLCVALKTRAEFDADEQSFLTLFAELTAKGLEVAKLHDDTTRRAHEAGFLVRMSAALDEAMSLESRCQSLVDLLVPELADFASIERPGGEPRVLAVAHCNPALLETLRELRTSVQVPESQPHSLAVARVTHEPQVLTDITPDVYDRYGLEPHARKLLGTLAPSSYVGLPMLARGELVATLLLAMSQSNRRYSDAHIAHLTDIANRAAVSLENARLYDHERWVAESLQRELLGRPLPQHDTVQLRSAYSAGGEQIEIGGDYFDSFLVGEHRIGIAVGDVVGRGIPAATAMSQLRTALRAFALDEGGPAETLDRLEAFSSSIPGSAFSTVAYAELDLRTLELSYACAGHPPPVLITDADGPMALWGGRSSLLGISGETPRTESRVQMAVGNTVVLYTDGLVESRNRPLDSGLAEMIELLRHDPAIDLDTLIQKLSVNGDHQDDICLLSLTITADPNKR